ncbi:MAG: SCO family protein [Cardiobacteriaceae bacterium]|nr:SCO family protein [Cardiobacteriaceae bacterium]
MSRFARRMLCLFAFATLTAQAAPSYEYELVDPQGQTKTQADFPGQYQLIAFGFTHCPDVCPTTLYDFKQVLAQMEKPERLQPIFITIDPKRDTSEVLAKYTGFFDKRILALVGSREAIDQTVTNFNASYGYQLDGKKIDPDNLPEGSGYVVFHSTLIYLLDREGKLLDVFDYQSGAKQLVAGIEKAIAVAEGQ